MVHWAYLAGIVLVIGCGPVAVAGEDSSAPNSDGSSQSGSGRGGTGGYGGGGTNPYGDGGPNCGIQMFMLQRSNAPNVLIVMDRSASMDLSAGSDTKWNQTTSALNQAVSRLQDAIKWGLEYFPTDDLCGQNGIAVPVAASNYAAISSSLSNQMPGGATPTALAIQNGANYLSGLTDNNPKYMLLATDGLPVCMGDAPQAVANARMRGFHTFVIGIATDSRAENTLNQMAQNGGSPRPGGPPFYYPISSVSDLVNAIDTIAGSIISCDLPLTMAPPYPDLVSVVTGIGEVPRDPSHTNGWDFGANRTSIIFYGSWCQDLRNGSIQDVRAIYGCPPVGVAPPSHPVQGR